MANVIYDNYVLGNKYESVLETKLNLQNFLTVDTDLAEAVGNKKKVVTKTVIGSVQDLGLGVGNDTEIEVRDNISEYVVETTQGRFIYFDEEAAADDKVVDAGVTGLGEKMINNFTSKAIDEWRKATLQQGYTANNGIGFSNVVDALALINLEDESNLFMLVNPNCVASLRKNLADDLKYVESFVRTGYIGSICGVPVYISKACHDYEAIIASKEAVTLFVKKNTEIEQERDANIRKNTIYARKASVVALTDERKVVRIARNPVSDASITNCVANTSVIAGAAATGSNCHAYVNNTYAGYAIANNNAYSITVTDKLATGDVVKVVASCDGYIDSVANITI